MGKRSASNLEFEPFAAQLTDAQFEEFKALHDRGHSNGNGQDADEFEENVERNIFHARARYEAQRRLRAERESVVELPRVGVTLAHALKKAPERIAYTVNDLLPTGGNVLNVGGFKVGKTTAIGNLVKSLADGEPFLGVFDTHLPEGRIAYLNYEVSESQFISWLRDLDVRNPDRIVPLNLRGQRLPFWVPEVRDRLASWLQGNEVRFLVLDPVGRAWRGLVENENDNANVRDFTDAVDELKAAADVPDALVAHHTGRKEHEQDAEHGRGATTLEDWMDAGWYLTKERDGTRMFRALGRDVEVAATALDFDLASRTMSFTGQTRAQRKHEGGMVRVLDALRELKEEGGRYPAPLGVWRTAIHGLGKTDRGPLMKQAVAEGYVEVEEGAKNARLHTLTKKGRVYLKKRAEAAS